MLRRQLHGEQRLKLEAFQKLDALRNDFKVRILPTDFKVRLFTLMYTYCLMTLIDVY